MESAAWVEMLEATGFELNDLSRRIWAEFGDLTIESSEARFPSSSLHVDPVDACIDALDEVSTLKREVGEDYSPLGMWSVQFRSYISGSGRTIAVGPRVMWELGLSFAEALDFVVNGDGGKDRARRVDWLNPHVLPS